jgi:small subunit ribosomal protein S7
MHVMPHVEVRSRRVGGLHFKFNANSSRQKNFNVKWLILYSRRKSMAQRLANECLAAAKEEGAAVKKRMDTHKMEITKLSHFRF